MSDDYRVGWKTSEFWLSVVAMFIGALLASGAIGEGSTVERIVGAIGNVLAALGYAGSRFGVKRAESIRRAAVVSALRAGEPSERPQ